MKRIAKGNTAEKFEYGENRICKLFYPEYPKEYIRHEFCNATMAWKLGIRTPFAHELIICNGREGIIYDRIIGEELCRKINVKNQTSFGIWMDKFVEFHKRLWQYKAKDAMDYKDFLRMFATSQETIAKINLLADGNGFIHGDLHFENVIVDEDGNLVLIDMMNVCKGPALYDIARTYFLLRYDADIQNEYLKRTGYILENIAPYLDVILAVGGNEMKR